MTWSAIYRISPIVVLSLVACGGSSPPAEEPKVPPPVVAPSPEPEPVAEPATVTPPAEDAKPEPREPRAPIAVIENPAGPVTVGYNGAVFRLDGGAELRVPYGAFARAQNIVFSIDSKHKGDQGKVGDVFLVQTEVPDSSIQVAVVRASRPVRSSGDPFVLKLPIPGNSDIGNLAVETVEVDDKGRGKSTWTVVARSKLETADTGNRAVFELPQLPDGHVHVTTRSP